MSPVFEYKKLEKRIVRQCAVWLRLGCSRIGEGLGNLFSQGRQRFTVILIPHSEKKSFSFRVSLFLMIFIAALSLGVLVSFIYLSTHYGGISRLLSQRSAALAESEANLEIIRDEITEASKVSSIFQATLNETLKAMKMNVNTGFAFPAGGADINTVLDIGEREAGLLPELSELQSIHLLMERSVDDMKNATQLLVSVNDLLVELPTLWPLQGVQGRLMPRFGLAIHPFTGQLYLHKGIDLAYARGTPIIAAAGGKVIERGYEALNYGNYVKIQHSYGFYTKYGHLDSVYVEEGDEVRQGERIGTMGSTGLSTGPHLHFEVHLGSQVLDPLRYLNIQNDLVEE